MKKEVRIVCIGMGYLMEKMEHCYTKLLGDSLATNMLAVTIDEKDLERKRQKFPFEVQLGDNLGALRKMKPNFILFAPPPQFVSAIVEQDLVPYFEECRAAGDEIPMICAFPPAPSGEYYMQKLGDDLLICNALPKFIIEIGGEKVRNEGVSCLTFPERGRWTNKDKDFIVDFLSPAGKAVELKAKDVMNTLAVGTNIINLALVLDSIYQGLAAAGINVSYNQVGASCRFSLRKHTGYTAGGHLPVGNEVEPKLAKILEQFILQYYDALVKYCVMTGINETKADEFNMAFADMYLHLYSVEGREASLKHVKDQATAGGVAERGAQIYQEELSNRLIDVFSAAPVQDPPDAFFDYVETYVIECCKRVAQHGAQMASARPRK